ELPQRNAEIFVEIRVVGGDQRLLVFDHGVGVAARFVQLIAPLVAHVTPPMSNSRPPTEPDQRHSTSSRSWRSSVSPAATSARGSGNSCCPQWVSAPGALVRT